MAPSGVQDPEIHRWAEAIDTAHQRRRLLDPITDGAALTLDDAYAIQRELTARRLARGQRLVGWKLGYTSAAMREQMGVAEPNLGPLLDGMLLDNGSPVAAHLVQPRVEPEIALVLARDLPPGADPGAAVAVARAALEVVDSVWRGYRFRLEDNTADGSSAAQVALGGELSGPLDSVTVVLRHNGTAAARSTGAAAMGHPLSALAWLAAELGRQGDLLRAGDVVITGGLTAAVPLAPGDVVEAVFAGGAMARVSRSSGR